MTAMIGARPVVVRAATAEPAEVPDRARLPWAVSDIRRLVRNLALGGTGLVLAWTVASGTTQVSRQGYAIVGGVVAAVAAAAGCAGWLLSGTRAVRAERARLMVEVNALIARRSPQPTTTLEAGLVTANGMRHFHQATCPMARGKALRPVTAQDSLGACPICSRADG
ncbi:MAG: hypothetical protein ABR549_17635 [Mycobacteriales bacterium]